MNILTIIPSHTLTPSAFTFNWDLAFFIAVTDKSLAFLFEFFLGQDR